MQNNKQRNIRLVCSQTVEELMSSDNSIVNVSSDGNDFIKLNRERHFDVGIAEQNLIGVASGLALSGKRAVINSISSFMLTNAFLQIRNNISYPNLNVVMIGIGAGVSYGSLGYTHHSCEDIALMNLLPNVKIYLPSDPVEAKFAIKDALERGGPSYVRIRTGQEDVIFDETEIKFDEPTELTKEGEITLLASGICVSEAIRATRMLKDRQAHLLNINSLGIYSLDKLLPYFEGKKAVFCIEEHFIDSGIGSRILNELYLKMKTPFIKIGLKKEFCDFCGTSTELLHHYGLDSEGIINSIIAWRKHG